MVSVRVGLFKRNEERHGNHLFIHIMLSNSNRSLQLRVKIPIHSFPLMLLILLLISFPIEMNAVCKYFQVVRYLCRYFIVRLYAGVGVRIRFMVLLVLG